MNNEEEGTETCVGMLAGTPLFLVVIQLLGAICLFYGAWLGLSSRASARHRTASNTLCPVKVFSSGIRSGTED